MKNKILSFIHNYFSNDEYFFIGFNNHHNKRDFKEYKHNKESFIKHIEKIYYHNQEKSLYFTFNSFNKDNYHKTKENVLSIKSIVFDFDDVETSLKCLNNIIKVFPNFNYVLKTSQNKFQILYYFNEEITDRNLFEEFELINKTLSVYFGSDTNVCSIEKYFRLPYTVNKKNDFQTEITFKNLKSDFKDFKDFVFSNDDLKKIFEELKNKDKTKKVKSLLTDIDAKTEIKKLENKINFTELDFTIEEKLLKKYISILKYVNDDSSICDILYIKERKKIETDYNLIFNEILIIRKNIDKPLKRDLVNYFIDRKKIFDE